MDRQEGSGWTRIVRVPQAELGKEQMLRQAVG